MKLAALILISISSSIEIYPHEGKQAFYQLRVEHGDLMLISKMEIPDVKKCLDAERFCEKEQDFYWCAAEWIATYIKVEVNGQSYPLAFETSYKQDGHLMVTHLLGETPESIADLRITNRCFLQTMPEYENIIQIKTESINEGYKLNAERTTFTLN